VIIAIGCRCGQEHVAPSEPRKCWVCFTDTYDFHGICARCRGHEESLAAEAESGSVPVARSGVG
jgi:hypothetical protein